MPVHSTSAPQPRRFRTTHSVLAGASHWRFRSERAFTLIEILVVVIIAGIISAVALLSFGLLGGDDRDLEQDARRLSSLIQVVNDDAVLQGRDFGLELMLSSYRWVEHDPYIDEWFEVTDDEIMRSRQLDEGTEFELYVEEHRVLLQEEAMETEKDEDETDRELTEAYLPHVLVLSSGDITPFELRLVRTADRAEVTLTMSLMGEMEITNDDDAPAF